MVSKNVDTGKSYKGKPIFEDRYVDCVCKEKQRKLARLKALDFPPEFKNCTFDNFEVKTGLQQNMFESVKRYFIHLRNFIDKEKDEWPKKNSIGMIAELGEQTIKKIPDPDKKQDYLEKYNSFGLGKTHLLAASAYSLVDRYEQTVEYIRDVEIMRELQSIKFSDPVKYTKRLEELTRCDFLIWDDLAKSKASEAKEEIYYEIINIRYVQNRPILFSTNEDEETLGDKVGQASLDRLVQMTGDFLLSLKGESYRRS